MNPPAGPPSGSPAGQGVPGPSDNPREDATPLPRRRPVLAYGPGTNPTPWVQTAPVPPHQPAVALWGDIWHTGTALDYQPAPPLADVLTAYALRPWNGRTP